MLFASNPANPLVVIEMESENCFRKGVVDGYQPLAMLGAPLARDTRNVRRERTSRCQRKGDIVAFPAKLPGRGL
ncbi:hypothetical protein K7711_47150, partial [Nocardia sp. CA2R105]|uniref:hypothetical protein n=1 Tax=Nocardia coffeae TaxID=2873381 RepID=UPI001CA71C3A